MTSAVLGVIKLRVLFRHHTLGLNPPLWALQSSACATPGHKVLFFRARGLPSSLPRERMAIYKHLVCPQPYGQLVEKGWESTAPHTCKGFWNDFPPKNPEFSPILYILKRQKAHCFPEKEGGNSGKQMKGRRHLCTSQALSHSLFGFCYRPGGVIRAT